MKAVKGRRHLVMMLLLLIFGILDYIQGQFSIAVVSTVYEDLNIIAPGKYLYPGHIVDAVNSEYFWSITIIAAYIPYSRFRSSMNLIPEYYNYNCSAPTKTFLLTLFHEKMLHYEFVNLVVYMTFFIFVFCLYALESYRSGYISRLAEVFPIPSEEEAQLFRLFNDFRLLRSNKAGLFVTGSGCLFMVNLSWKKIQYNYGKIKEIASKTSLPIPNSSQNR